MNHDIKHVCLSKTLEVESDECATLLELRTGQNPTADHTFAKMIVKINDFSVLQLTQSKIQEVLDKVALNKIIENQKSEREKARFLSFSLPTGTHSPSLAKRVFCSCEVQTWRSHI